MKILRDAEASSLRKCLAAMVVWGCTAVIHADRRRKVRDSLKIPLETKSRFGVLRRSATPSLCPVGTLYPGWAARTAASAWSHRSAAVLRWQLAASVTEPLLALVTSDRESARTPRPGVPAPHMIG